MSSVNKTILVGNLCRDVETRYTPNGQAVCDLRVATSERYTNKAGEKVESAEFHTVTVWGKQAESCGKYLTKGRQVYVEGRLHTRKWTDKEGQTRYSTEIVANQVQFLGSARRETAPQTESDDSPPEA
jgi:single-strand DNA-binding protein